MLMMVKIWRVMILGGIKGVTEEFTVQLARVVKDAQADEHHTKVCKQSFTTSGTNY